MILINFLYKPINHIKLSVSCLINLRNLNNTYVYINKVTEYNILGSVTYYSFNKEVSELFTNIKKKLNEKV